MKHIFAFAIIMSSILPMAGGTRSLQEIMKTPVKELTPEEHAIRTEHIKAMRLKVFGGDIVKPNSQKGKIAIVNAQEQLPQAEIETAVAMIYKCAKFNFAIRPGNGDKTSLDRAASACADYSANVALVIVSDATTPAMLIAPEDRWAIVNVQKLAIGIPTGPLFNRMFAARCRKEIIRAFSLLCGGGASQFPENMMATSSVAGLDTVQEFISIDMEKRWRDYLADLGVKPAYQRTYKQACQEGWAPEPTNEIQKAIWNQVRKLPTKPIQIKFDPKRGK